MPERFQGSGSSSDEQWQLVGSYTTEVQEEPHNWRLRLFRNQHGKYRTGMRCTSCGETKVFTARQEQEMDRRMGRGQY